MIDTDVLAALRPDETPGEIRRDGYRIPLRYRAGSGTAMVILFHGGMNREKRPFPFFQPFLPVDAHQIAIADPTLAFDATMPTGWYLGREGSDLSAILSGLITDLAGHLDCDRRIYLGGSAGGFAALNLSWRDPGSVAIAANPQTDLQAYFIPEGVDLLRRTCWPSARNTEALARIAPIDMGALYAQGFANRVIYVQSAGDHDHVQGQLRPFLNAIGPAHREQLLLNVGFWNIPGHSGSAPTRAWLPWLRAALSAPRLASDDLLMAHHALLAGQQGAKPAARAAAPAARATAPDDRSAWLAEQVRAHLQRR